MDTVVLSKENQELYYTDSPLFKIPVSVKINPAQSLTH